jgi:hypothetical protein
VSGPAPLQELLRAYPDRGDGLHHFYDFVTPICIAQESFCDASQANTIEFGQPVPPPGRLVSGNVWDVRAWTPAGSVSIGWVNVDLYRDLYAHVNSTWNNPWWERGGHLLQQGAVFRQIYWEGDTLVTRTVGIGNNLTPGLAALNQAIGPLIFTYQTFWLREQLAGSYEQ